MSPLRKVCVVTGSRAEYGLLRGLMQSILAHPDLTLQVVVTGMHLAPEFGLTVREIEQDGFSLDDVVESQLASDSRTGMVKSLGLGLIGFADSFRRLAPDVVVVLGDRYEILAAAQAASLMDIPVAHISGGEVTEGAVDDWIRHAISKASWFHFVAAEPYRRRVMQLGEQPERVFNVGDPGLDAVNRLQVLTREELERDLGISIRPPFFLVTYHPVTLGDQDPEHAFRAMTSALDAYPAATVVLTRPNADAGGRRLAELAEAWALSRSGPTVCATSLGQVRYLSLMRLADAVVGNSSSGIVEAPALKVATVNIGPRQEGRLKAASIIDCEGHADAIQAALARALSPAFRSELPQTVSLYGDCNASAQICRLLAEEALPRVLRKRFHDV